MRRIRIETMAAITSDEPLLALIRRGQELAGEQIRRDLESKRLPWKELHPMIVCDWVLANWSTLGRIASCSRKGRVACRRCTRTFCRQHGAIHARLSNHEVLEIVHREVKEL